MTHHIESKYADSKCGSNFKKRYDAKNSTILNLAQDRGSNFYAVLNLSSDFKSLQIS